MFLNSIVALMIVTTLSLEASAQRPVYIEEQAQSIANEIRREGRYLTPDQRIQIARHLESIERILRSGPVDQPTSGEYTCVSRDNDSRAPYVLAIREGIHVVRMNGESFSSISECQNTLNTAREIAGRYFFCASRDNDGRSPYQIAALNGAQINRIQRTISSSKQQCEALVQSLQPRRGLAQFCTSRDNDGRSPYVAAALNVRTLELQVGTEVFNSLSACEEFLKN